ncbi:MAG: hypothetical protein JWO82_3845 [Akkermansiaceae bacterium]|nr:hypothetical protein [Akkermansiaceae bacterium]
MRLFHLPPSLAVTALLLAVAAPARAAIIPVASATASSQFEGNSPLRTINASGITAPMTTESELLVAGHDNNGNATSMWHGAVVTPPAAGQFLIWNFASASSLRTIYYWNHNQNNLTNRGIKDVEIQISKDNGTTYSSLGSFVLIQAAGLAGERPHTIELPASQTGVTNVRFNIASNFGGNVVGFSEIRFSDIPVPVPAPFVTFSATPAIVRDGAPVTLSWTSENVTAINISPGGSQAALSGTTNVTAPVSADTTYTLTGTAGSNSATAKAIVRSVPGGTSNYRYVRFTPKKFRGAGNSVQIAEMSFFKTAGGTDQVVPIDVTNPDGSNPVGQEPLKIIDGDITTKWLDFNKSSLTFDFGDSPQSFTEYQFVTAGDAAERDPVQWILEGSNEPFSLDWVLLDSVTAFDYPIPLDRGVASALIPLPGSYINSLKPVIDSFTIKRDIFFPDLPTYVDWHVSGAVRIGLKVGTGAEQDVTENGGHLELLAPTAATTYKLTGYTASNVATSLTLSGAAPVATLPATISYPSFDAVGQDIIVNGPATAINDFVTMPAAGDKLRLRIVPDIASQSGSAWFYQKVPVSGGFDTSFGLQFASKDRGFGAEGLAFIIQNTAEGTASLPGQTGPDNNALTVEFSTWNNNAANETPPDTAYEAQIRIYKGIGTGTDRQAVANYNLRNTALVATLRGQANSTFTGDYASTPYAARIVYSAAGVMDVYVDGVRVVDSLPVALDGATDAEGKAYVGFAAATGGFWQNSDITSWTLTSGTGAPSTPLKLTASSINPATGALSLTWSSTTGKTYRVTGSADLATWTTQLKTGIAAAAGGSTTTTTTFVPGAVRFFRVEEE